MNTDQNGFAIHGYDPVAYHQAGAARPGDSVVAAAATDPLAVAPG